MNPRLPSSGSHSSRGLWQTAAPTWPSAAPTSRLWTEVERRCPAAADSRARALTAAEVVGEKLGQSALPVARVSDAPMNWEVGRGTSSPGPLLLVMEHGFGLGWVEAGSDGPRRVVLHTESPEYTEVEAAATYSTSEVTAWARWVHQSASRPDQLPVPPPSVAPLLALPSQHSATVAQVVAFERLGRSLPPLLGYSGGRWHCLLASHNPDDEDSPPWEVQVGPLGTLRVTVAGVTVTEPAPLAWSLGRVRSLVEGVEAGDLAALWPLLADTP